MLRDPDRERAAYVLITVARTGGAGLTQGSPGPGHPRPLPHLPHPGASLAMRRPGGVARCPTPGHPTRRLRARATRTRPRTYAYRAPPAHQRHAPRRGRAARAAPPLTQNTNYKSTKRVTPLYSAQTVRTAPNAHLYHLPMRTQKARLGETDRVTLPGPAGIAARQRCVMIWSQLSIGSVVSSVYLDPGVFRARA